MPSADILISSPVESTFRVQQVRGMFDLPDASFVEHRWSINLPIEGEPWKIGLIVGPSGCGKSVTARRLFPNAVFIEQYEWPEKKSILDGFDSRIEGKAITEALSSVGFSSPPYWVKRYSHLSNGQKMRCDLARAILEDAPIVVFDEFTSVVDRTVAKICSAAVSKAIRRKEKPQFVMLSCHYDIIEWLNPDWIYDFEGSKFAWRRLQRRPEIKLEIHVADRGIWEIFRHHHYLNHDLASAAKCVVACIDGRPVAFSSFIHFPHASDHRMKMGHRTVVLPDFQGIGIGNALSEWLGNHLTHNGWRFFSTTSHPAMIRHRLRDPRWRLMRKPSHVSTTGKTSSTRGSYSNSRITASFEFLGNLPDKNAEKSS